MGHYFTKPICFVLLGYPGAGKSYFARRFEEDSGALLLSSDRIRFELFDEPGFTKGEEAVVERIRDYSFESLLKTGKSIILDGDYMLQKSRKSAYAAAQAAGYEPITIWIQTDIDTARQRAEKRDKRNKDNAYSFDIDDETFEMLAKKLKKPGTEPFIVVSGRHDYSVQKKTVFNKLLKVKLLANKSEQKTEHASQIREIMRRNNKDRRARPLSSIPTDITRPQ